jgi:hypothetical protein
MRQRVGHRMWPHPNHTKHTLEPGRLNKGRIDCRNARVPCQPRRRTPWGVTSPEFFDDKSLSLPFSPMAILSRVIWPDRPGYDFAWITRFSDEHGIDRFHLSSIIIPIRLETFWFWAVQREQTEWLPFVVWIDITHSRTQSISILILPDEFSGKYEDNAMPMEKQIRDDLLRESTCNCRRSNFCYVTNCYYVRFRVAFAIKYRTYKAWIRPWSNVMSVSLDIQWWNKS